MPSLQNSAPGAKSSKIKGLSPFAPFLTQPGQFDEDDDDSGVPESNLSESLDQRLRISQTHGSTAIPPQSHNPASPQQYEVPPTATQGPSTNSNTAIAQKKPTEKKENEERDSDSDSDLDEFDDDDEALQAFRQRRLAEMKKDHGTRSTQKGLGHGEVRTISQDEFLPECTGASKFVCVHFFHDQFERCKIMDQHLKIIAPLHMSCKFVRINAEKAPFFVAKLAIKTLPTLLIFKDGKTIERLLGFDGLSDTKDPDQFSTSRLGRWLEKTGAIEYEGPDSDDEDDGRSTQTKTGMLSSRFRAYDEDI